DEAVVVFSRVGAHGAAITKGTKGLARVETECPVITDRSRYGTATGGARRLGNIFDYGELVTGGYLQQWCHVHCLPGEVHGDYCFGFRCNSSFQLFDVHQVSGTVYVHEYWSCPCHRDCRDGGNGSMGNHQHFVAHSHSGCCQGEIDRLGTGGATN